MSIAYNGEHGISFWRKSFIDSTFVIGDRYATENPKFSWDDFHLIPLERPFIASSKPNHAIVPAPNSSKRFLVTDYLSGGLTYESRTGTWDFALDHDQWGNWVTAHQAIEEYFNGSRMLVALNDDPTKIFEGRTMLKDYSPGDDYSTVKIGYDLEADPITVFDNILFRIRFLGRNGNVLQTKLRFYGDAAYYTGTVPQISGMVFDRWTPSPVSVAGNMDYKAVYKQG